MKFGSLTKTQGLQVDPMDRLGTVVTEVLKAVLAYRSFLMVFFSSSLRDGIAPSCTCCL